MLGQSRLPSAVILGLGPRTHVAASKVIDVGAAWQIFRDSSGRGWLGPRAKPADDTVVLIGRVAKPLNSRGLHGR